MSHRIRFRKIISAGLMILVACICFVVPPTALASDIDCVPLSITVTLSHDVVINNENLTATLLIRNIGEHVSPIVKSYLGGRVIIEKLSEKGKWEDFRRTGIMHGWPSSSVSDSYQPKEDLVLSPREGFLREIVITHHLEGAGGTIEPGQYRLVFAYSFESSIKVEGKKVRTCRAESDPVNLTVRAQ